MNHEARKTAAAPHNAKRLPRTWPMSTAAMFAAAFTCLAVVGVWGWTGWTPIITGDSPSHIQFAAFRASFYPLFIAAFGGDSQLAVLAQSAVYSATLCWLIYVLHRRFNSRLVTVGLGLTVSCNPFLWAYSAAIMAEALTLAMVNVLLVAFVYMTDRGRDDYLRPVCLAAFAVGVMAGLRPATWSFAPATLVMVVLFAWWRGRVSCEWMKALVCAAGVVAVVAAAEAAGFYAVHDKRASLVPHHLYGKAAVLTMQADFAIPPLPPAERELIERTASLMRPFKEYLNDERAPELIKSDLRRYAEGFGQWGVLPWLAAEGLGAEPVAADKERIAWAVIAANPAPFLRLILSRYIDAWAIDSSAYAIVRHNAKLPVFTPPALNRAVPLWLKRVEQRRGDWYDLFRYSITFPAFALLGAVCLLASLRLCWVWSRVARKRLSVADLPPQTMLMTAALFIGQANIVFVCLASIPGFRYSMPTFPLFVLACLLWFQSSPFARRWNPARA